MGKQRNVSERHNQPLAFGTALAESAGSIAELGSDLTVGKAQTEAEAATELTNSRIIPLDIPESSVLRLRLILCLFCRRFSCRPESHLH